jgi:hypothetical protein
MYKKANLPNYQWTSLTINALGDVLYSVHSNSSLSESAIYKSIDYGVSWLEIPINSCSPNNLVDSWVDIACDESGENVIVCGNNNNNYVAVSNNTGLVWRNNLTPSIQWTSIAISGNGNIMYAVSYTDNDSAYISINAGISFYDVFSIPVNKIICDGTGNIVYFYDFKKNVYKSTDTFQTFFEISTNIPNQSFINFTSICCNNNGEIIVICGYNGTGDFGSISTSLDGGSTWINGIYNNQPFNDMFTGVSSNFDSSKLYTITGINKNGFGTGTIYISIDYGINWTLISTYNIELIDLTGYDFNNIDVNEDGTKLLISVNNGGLYTIYFSGIPDIIPDVIPIQNICFYENTLIETDQGRIPIEKIKINQHTINNNEILHVTKSYLNNDYLVVFEKDSIMNNYPMVKTIISKEHKIYWNHKMRKADYFLQSYLFPYVNRIKYNGEIMYNILLKTHSLMRVHGLLVETLSPNNFISKLYFSKLSKKQKNTIILYFNKWRNKVFHKRFHSQLNFTF